MSNLPIPEDPVGDSMLQYWYLLTREQIIFQTDNPWNELSWTDAVHFNFNGYDTSPFWDDDGTAYIVGSHAYRVE